MSIDKPSLEAMGIIPQMPLFPQFIVPDGGLDGSRECHALFYYYILARKAYENEKDATAYEGDKDSDYSYFSLFESVSRIYGVTTEGMAKCWSNVDYTCAMHNLPKLPDNAKYRINMRIVLN